MEQCGVLPEFKGIAMHDCWASYWNYPDIQHAVCCAHLLRELTGIDENHPEQKWASAFIDLLLETWSEEKRKNPCPCRTPCELQGPSLPFYS